jgi:hypothetical protein
MLYKKINLELIVPADESDGVVAELGVALDYMEKRYALFGGAVETVLVEHSGRRRKSALTHAMDAGKTAVGALQTARKHVTAALHLVV